jgi:hypothetical protein
MIKPGSKVRATLKKSDKMKDSKIYTTWIYEVKKVLRQSKKFLNASVMPDQNQLDSPHNSK